MIASQQFVFRTARQALCIVSILAGFINGAALAQDRTPEATTTPLAQAQLALEKRDWAVAELLLNPLIKAEPQNPYPYFELAQLYENTNRVEAARNIYRAIAAIPANEKDRYVVIAVKNGQQTMMLLPDLAQEKLALLANSAPTPAAPPVVPPTAASPPVTPSTVPIAAPPSPVVPATAATTVAAPSAAQPATSIESTPPVLAMREWLAAWQNRQLKSYFASYVPGYKGDLASAAAWQKARESRITSKTKININAHDVSVKPIDAQQSLVSFTQAYVSPTHTSSISKTLTMINSNGRWLISKETSK
jgi:hypothetical protein